MVRVKDIINYETLNAPENNVKINLTNHEQQITVICEINNLSIYH